MILKINKGKIFRAGVATKEFGERLGHRKITSWFCRPVILLGQAIKGMVANCPIEELR